MKENSIRKAVREGRAALGTGLKEFASRGVPHIIQHSGFDYCMTFEFGSVISSPKPVRMRVVNVPSSITVPSLSPMRT